MRVIVTQPDGPIFHFQFCKTRITSNMASLDFNVIAGKGDPGVGVPSGGTAGQVLQKATNADYETEWSDPSGGVTDVQVNGTSIVQDGVANVPLAASGVLGVCKPGGLGVSVNAYGELVTTKATSAEAKAGAMQYRSIVPYNQHEATFYGLTKAAGVDMASSSNPVGTYTDAARIAIQKMLGLYQAPFRTIKTITISEETGTIYFNRDDDNQEFSLTEIVVLFQAVTATANGNGAIVANNGSAGTGTNVAFVTIYNVYNTSAQTRVAHALITGGRFLGESSAASFGNTYGTQTIHRNLNSFGIIVCDPIYELSIGSLNGYKFTGGTITVYGR